MKRMPCFPQVCYSVYSWSLTAGANAGADAAINFAEGQTPSSVNDSARAMMAALVAHVRDSGASGTTAGTATAYTLSLNQAMLSRIPALIGFTAHASNGGGGTTLNVDGTGAAPLRAVTGTALAANAIVAGCAYLATWVAGSSEWLLLNPAVGAVPLAGGTMTGALVLNADPVTALGAATKQYADGVGTTSVAHTVSAGTGLTGGGAISTNPTISVAPGGITSTQLAANAVTTTAITDANVTPAKLSQPMTYAASQATTSGTIVTFGSIPSWVTRVRMMLDGVSTSGTSPIRFRIGSGGTPLTTGYVTAALNVAAGTPGQFTATAGVSADSATENAGWTRYGSIEFIQFSAASNIWVISGSITNAISPSANQYFYTSTATLPGALDSVYLTTVNGTDTFDAGAVNIVYQ